MRERSTLPPLPANIDPDPAEAERDRYRDALQDIVHASRDEGLAAMIQWMRSRAIAALTEMGDQ